MGHPIAKANPGDAIEFMISEGGARSVMYVRVHEVIVCKSYEEMLTGGGRTVADFLPGSGGMSVEEAALLYRGFTAAKYNNPGQTGFGLGIEKGAVALRVSALGGR